jgi:hypothetical protein
MILLMTSEKLNISFIDLSSFFSLNLLETNQGLIMDKGGVQLLAKTASKTDDPQTLRMVAGALANLCGNGKLMVILQHPVKKYSFVICCMDCVFTNRKATHGAERRRRHQGAPGNG